MKITNFNEQVVYFLCLNSVNEAYKVCKIKNISPFPYNQLRNNIGEKLRTLCRYKWGYLILKEKNNRFNISPLLE